MDALVLFRNRFFHLPQRPSEHVGESCVLARGGLFSGSPFRVDVGFHLSSPPGASGVPPLPQNLPGAGLQEELSRILVLPEGGFVPQVMPNSVCRWFGGSQVGRHLPPLPPPLLGREPRVLLDTESHTGHPPPGPPDVTGAEAEKPYPGGPSTFSVPQQGPSVPRCVLGEGPVPPCQLCRSRDSERTLGKSEACFSLLLRPAGSGWLPGFVSLPRSFGDTGAPCPGGGMVGLSPAFAQEMSQEASASSPDAGHRVPEHRQGWRPRSRGLGLRCTGDTL